MRELRRGMTALMAIFAIALHALLMPLAPASGATFDPLAVTCLSGGHEAASDPTGAPTQHQTLGCDDCVLCGSAPPPQAPDASVSVSFSLPTQTVIWSAATNAVADNLSATPELPTGPPASV